MKFKADHLYEGSDYLFRVAAINPIGCGPFSQIEESVTAKLPFGTLTISCDLKYLTEGEFKIHTTNSSRNNLLIFFFILGPPNKPQNLLVSDLTKEEVTLKWEEPDFDGGAPIIGYYVEKRQAFTSRWTKVNRQPTSDLRFKVNDLIEDDEYEFRIVAENEAGCSRPSETTGTFRARDPYDKPGKPSRPDAIIEADTVSLSWSKPLDDGRSKITNYVVEMKAVKDVRWKTVNVSEKVDITR